MERLNGCRRRRPDPVFAALTPGPARPGPCIGPVTLPDGPGAGRPIAFLAGAASVCVPSCRRVRRPSPVIAERRGVLPSPPARRSCAGHSHSSPLRRGRSRLRSIRAGSSRSPRNRRYRRGSADLSRSKVTLTFAHGRTPPLASSRGSSSSPRERRRAAESARPACRRRPRSRAAVEPGCRCRSIPRQETDRCRPTAPSS